MKTQVMDKIERTVTLDGLTDLMFDRYAGDNKTQLPVESKLYYMPDGKTLCLPAMNLMSFLSAKNTTSIAKIVGGKSWAKICDASLSYISVSPFSIPIMRDGEPIEFYGFRDGRDDKAKIYVHKSVARLKGGIPNPKERPTIELPWSITFQLTLFKNDVIDETYLQTAFLRGGMALGLGTFRGVFGKFQVSDWK
jgi:hypothetical protein